MTWNDRKWERMNCASKSKCSWGEVYPDVQPTATLQRALKEAKGSSTIRSKAGLGSISPTEIKGWWWSSQPLYITSTWIAATRKGRKGRKGKVMGQKTRLSGWALCILCQAEDLRDTVNSIFFCVPCQRHVILQYQSPWISLDGFSMFQYVSVTRPRGCRMCETNPQPPNLSD